MSISDNPTAFKIFQSFMVFGRFLHRLNWHGTDRTHGDLRVLFWIKQGERNGSAGMNLTDISRRLHVSAPTITQFIRNLEANGLVERTADETDKRVFRLRLTDKGEHTVQEVEDTILNSLNGLIAYLGEEQSQQLATLLSKVYTYYNERECKTGGDDDEC